VDSLLECDQVRDLDLTCTRCSRVLPLPLLAVRFRVLNLVWLLHLLCRVVCFGLLGTSCSCLAQLVCLASLDRLVVRVLELTPVFDQREESELRGLDTAALEQILSCESEQIVFECGASFAVEHDLLGFERFLVGLVLVLVQFDSGVCVFRRFVVCELDFERVQIRDLLVVFERGVELEVVDQEGEFLVLGLSVYEHFTEFSHVHVLLQFH